MHDPAVFIHKTVLMQRLLDAVSRGYIWHTAGVAPLNKAQRLADRFAERYEVHHNANQRAYARRQGRASARLFLLAQPDADELHWWLVATTGDGLVHECERLKDANDKRQRLRIADDYELTRRTRLSNKGGGTVWSWRMTGANYTAWRERIIAACRRPHPLEIRRAIASLYRTPGYSGVRVQVGKLMTLARSEWRRRHGNVDALGPAIKLRYVERLRDTSAPLCLQARTRRNGRDQRLPAIRTAPSLYARWTQWLSESSARSQSLDQPPHDIQVFGAQFTTEHGCAHIARDLFKNHGSIVKWIISQ